MELITSEIGMTDATGREIHEEINDLRGQFREFRKIIIGGAIAMVLSMATQAGIVAWNASEVHSQVRQNQKEIQE